MQLKSLLSLVFNFTGNFYAYKPVLLGDGNHSISKCQIPLASNPRKDVESEFAHKAVVFDAIGKV